MDRMTDEQPTEQLVRYHNALETLGPERLKQALRDMYLIRAFEETLDELRIQGKTYGSHHLSMGQEATSVGARLGLEPGDYFLSHHRGHGHALAWGRNPNATLAEILGKTTGLCQGRGGSMHMADVANGNLGGNGIVGGGLPMSVGVGLSIRMRKTSQVCLCIFGDGAANEGAFHEALNMASIYRLPVLYLCENNQYAMSTPVKKAFNIERIAERACAYGIPGVTVDGNDLLAVYAAIEEAASRARRGEGPTLIESVTYRYKGHSRSDRQVYRTRDEIREWMELRDPITRFSRLMIAAGTIDEAENAAMRDQAQAQINQAVEFAMSSPDPDPASVLEYVYA